MTMWRAGFGLLLLGGVLAASFWLFQQRQAAPSVERELMVAATVFPIADMIKNVGGERVGVVLLIPPGVSEHSAALSPQILAQVAHARALFAIGSGLDDALVQRVVAAHEMPVVTLERGIALREFGESEDGHEHDEGPDPHYWLTVPNAIKMTETIAAELTKLDPEGAAVYQENLRVYQEKLIVLESELQAKVQQVQSQYFMAAHDAWSYFAAHYCLNLVATYEPVEGQEPSVRQLQQIGEAVRQFGLKTFYSEPQKTNASETSFLEREFGLKIMVLDPIGGTEPHDSYEALMQRNMDAIAAGNGIEQTGNQL